MGCIFSIVAGLAGLKSRVSPRPSPQGYPPLTRDPSILGERASCLVGQKTWLDCSPLDWVWTPLNPPLCACARARARAASSARGDVGGKLETSRLRCRLHHPPCFSLPAFASPLSTAESETLPGAGLLFASCFSVFSVTLTAQLP